ncbi:SDR family oxidoreductase [Nitrolancea hollandica]|uniref:Putative Oxidoreductase n=1 Tax=Nitrolancea hollandica Lb TaxID=1129897 RepID=I4EM15_9BACT|nr:SDR family NAD(P)-dependent oxidoreductase [Nitrolancea hollandica]CCF85728.1 putative Oxidoreductase [Nitrolancea hollandica Lb]
MAELCGKVALVTGAGSGVGRATSLLLAREGAVIGLLGRRLDPLEAVAQEIHDLAGRALVLPADVSDERAVEQAIERINREFDGLDFLINSAAVGLYGPVETYSLEDWRQTIATNVTGVFLCCRAVLPLLRKRGGGQIITISSGAGKRGYANLAAYSTSKFAVMGFMESLAEEAGPLGIKCTTVVPGSILTGFGPRSIEQKLTSGKKYLRPEDVADAVVQVLRQPAHVWTQEMNVWPF